jgi:AcrR family transcriptional regulator
MSELLIDRRRQLIRDEIARVAMGLFAEQGFDSVTVDDIAAAAGTSPRTFFRYFATKDDVVLDYERRLQKRLLDALVARPADEGPVTALREAYLTTSHVEPDDRVKVVQRGRILAGAPALRARAHGERIAEDDALVEEISRRLRGKQPNVRARIIVAAMGAVAATEFRTWVDEGGRRDPAQRISAGLALLEAGLASLE